jgi:uncharacterized protein (DUF697 family)
MNVSEDKLLSVHLIIHSCATAAAFTAGAASMLPVIGPMATGTVVLTGLTVGMVAAIGNKFGQTFETGAVVGLVGQILGMTFGTSLLQTALSLIPGVGAVSNATITFGVTEAIGWGAYLIFRDGKDVTQLNPAEFKDYMEQGKSYANTAKGQFQWLEELPPHIKAQYDYLTNKLTKADLSDTDRQAVLKEIEALIMPYKPAPSATI